MTYTLEQIRQLNLHGPQTVMELCDEVSDVRAKLADTRAKLSEIKKHWLAIESELPTGIEYEVKNRNKFVWAYTQLRHLLDNI